MIRPTDFSEYPLSSPNPHTKPPLTPPTTSSPPDHLASKAEFQRPQQHQLLDPENAQCQPSRPLQESYTISTHKVDQCVWNSQKPLPFLRFPGQSSVVTPKAVLWDIAGSFTVLIADLTPSSVRVGTKKLLTVSVLRIGFRTGRPAG